MYNSEIQQREKNKTIGDSVTMLYKYKNEKKMVLHRNWRQGVMQSISSMVVCCMGFTASLFFVKWYKLRRKRKIFCADAARSHIQICLTVPPPPPPLDILFCRLYPIKTPTQPIQFCSKRHMFLNGYFMET